ncbi:MAG: 2-octaprenyl-6-methoxyphenyl hydroxylase [Rhodospirillaceae bacterium]|nr:2-octaprenyl-6-methoxyphenyl hydroxylase [Rhodospirillaceae bacterium]
MAEGTDLKVDAIVVGGGMAGTTMGLALAKGGLSVAVIERQAPPAFRDPTFDGRTSAIAYGSANVFDGIGVWSQMVPVAQPIWDIRVADGTPWDGPSSLFLHYDHQELGETPLGYILENRDIRDVLLHEASAETRLHLLAPAVVARTERDIGGATVTLEDRRRISARLIVGADGRNSPLRETAGIRETRFDYPQTAIVCTVAHERPHAGVAVELFLPAGPFAMLPMTEQRSSIVWTEKKDQAQDMLALDDESFHYELHRRFGDWLGEIRVEGPRFVYPLGLMHAERYTDRRLALIGDAAHVIHPIAGQGLNMGIRDVAALAEAVVDAHRLGLDIGDGPVLARYERWRRFDNVFMAATTDALNRLFSNDIGPLRLARDLGLAAINRLPPAKRFFMRHAMGVVGDLPRLVKGEPI